MILVIATVEAVVEAEFRYFIAISSNLFCGLKHHVRAKYCLLLTTVHPTLMTQPMTNVICAL